MSNQSMVTQALNAIDEASIDKTLELNALRKIGNEKIEDNCQISKKEEDLNKVNEMVDKLMGVDFSDGQIREGVVEGLRQLNENVMDEASNFTSEALQKRMSTLQDGKDDFLMNGMFELNESLNQMHPSNHNLVESWYHKSLLPFLSPVRKYFMKFQTMQTVINGYKEQLELGINDRELDMEILRQDKNDLYRTEKILNEAIEFNNLLQLKIEERIKSDVSDKEQKKFLEGQILSNLLRQTQGFQEMRAVNLQGQMSFEMLLKTGRDVIESSKRCIRISISALTIAAVIQNVMTGQKKLLEATKAINETATKFVDWNAEQLSSTMVEVGRMAMETSLDINILIGALEKSTKAINDDISYRQEALTMVRDNIQRFDNASLEARKTTANLTKERNIFENNDNAGIKVFANT